MTHVTCRLTAKNRQLRNPTLGNQVWVTFTFLVQSSAQFTCCEQAFSVGCGMAYVRDGEFRGRGTSVRRGQMSETGASDSIVCCPPPPVIVSRTRNTGRHPINTRLGRREDSDEFRPFTGPQFLAVLCRHRSHA